jgi:arylformamidase
VTWVDVSVPLSAETAHWPGHPRFTVDDMLSMPGGDVMNVTAVAMCSHFATHVDAPRHYVGDGATVEQLPLDVLIGPCLVVDYDGDGHVPGELIASVAAPGLRRLLIRTRNSAVARDPRFHEDYVGLTLDAARALVAHGIELVGVDGPSIGPFDPELGIPVHQIFLGAGPHQIAVEQLDLSEIAPGAYDLIALPLAATGLEAAPARVVLRRSPPLTSPPLKDDHAEHHRIA